MGARRTPGWASIPYMEMPYPNERELLGLIAVASILGKLSTEERTRVLRYAIDRYPPEVRLGDATEVPS